MRNIIEKGNLYCYRQNNLAGYTFDNRYYLILEVENTNIKYFDFKYNCTVKLSYLDFARWLKHESRMTGGSITVSK